MRIAVLSDIHANLEALLAVEAALSGLAADAVVCLGDVVGYGASPNACCQRVRELAAVTLLGNHDAAVAGLMDYAYYYEAAREALDWTERRLAPAHLAWLRGLPYAHRIEDVAFCHGSPVHPEAYAYVFAQEQAEELLPHLRALAPVTFIGHSHLVKAYALGVTEVEELTGAPLALDPRRKHIISVGSVGQPRDYDSRACFAIYDSAARRVELHRVAYDVEEAARKVFEAGLAPNFGKRLFLGV